MLGTVFAALCLGGGSMFQSSQSFAQLANAVPALAGIEGAILFGGFLSFIHRARDHRRHQALGEVASLLESFIDTVIVWNMTGLVMVTAPTGGDAFEPVRGFAPNRFRGRAHRIVVSTDARVSD